ncbi:hypothetical protein [Streptomyces alkaliphilus]|uniref:hypothetical protein n=1 Tax=Streptomyces alkaliphilus TaxID=1472722 RepID=UPI001E4396C6|nr:hypothetical protein [Streptomyces alkaliphilus]
MRRPVTGEVHVHYGQIYVESDPDHGSPGFSEAFAGQSGGLCGAAVPGALHLVTGLHTGRVGFVVEVHEEAPPLDPAWEDVVEVSFRPASDRTCLVQWAGEAVWDLDLPRTDHRVRYCARGMDEGRRVDTRTSGEPEADSYLLQFWPAPPRPDHVVRRTSRTAAYWHRCARRHPPPPGPEQRAEARRSARAAEERAAEERRLRREREEWGGRPPSEELRGVGGCVRALLFFDSDLVHALDAAGAGARRAVALLAARRACEAAGLAEVPWVARALTALAEGRPLPPPFDDPPRLGEALRSDPRVPDRSVPGAIPPGRSPHHPATLPVTAARTWIPLPEPGDLRGAPDELPATGPAGGMRTPPGDWGNDTPVLTLSVGDRRGLLRTSQPHRALPAVLAAAGPNPLGAALEAVWHAMGTHGERHPELLEELRSVCSEWAGE